MTEVEEFLEHYGVKGMKWGIRNKVRKVRANRKNKRITYQQKQVDRIKRVSKGKGSRVDKLITSMNLPLYKIIEGGGLQGGAKNVLGDLKEQQRKVKAGEAKATSMLAKFYGYEIRDLKY